MLNAIGLDEFQESTYRTLVALGTADISGLAQRLTISEEEAVRTVRLLERQGLASRSTANPGHWVAAPPAVALGALLNRQRLELDQAEQAAALLAQEYRVESAEPTAQDLVEVVTGASAVAHRSLQLQLGATEEVCMLVTGRPPAVRGLEYAAGERPTGQGVRRRVVIERAVLSESVRFPQPVGMPGGEEQIRVVDRVPTQLVLADHLLAMATLSRREEEPSALVVRASGLLEALACLFEDVWRQALPLRLSGDGTAREERSTAPDSTDLKILSLLLAGLTDTSVARQLELGLRTVQRRVKGLMELTGVSTRLQLGWHAHERGWLARG